jgi:histidinol-phosphate aminotransferase
MHPSIIEELVKVKDAFNTNRLAQAAATASLDDNAFVKYCTAQNELGKIYLQKTKENGTRFFPFTC